MQSTTAVLAPESPAMSTSPIMNISATWQKNALKKDVSSDGFHRMELTPDLFIGYLTNQSAMVCQTGDHRYKAKHTIK